VGADSAGEVSIYRNRNLRKHRRLLPLQAGEFRSAEQPWRQNRKSAWPARRELATLKIMLRARFPSSRTCSRRATRSPSTRRSNGPPPPDVCSVPQSRSVRDRQSGARATREKPRGPTRGLDVLECCSDSASVWKICWQELD